MSPIIPRRPDEDAEYEQHRTDIDEGRKCPDCWQRSGIQRVETDKLPTLFVCPCCACQWFDFVTRPTIL